MFCASVFVDSEYKNLQWSSMYYNNLCTRWFLNEGQNVQKVEQDFALRHWVSGVLCFSRYLQASGYKALVSTISLVTTWQAISVSV